MNDFGEAGGDRLSIVIAGHVDHGKSTLVGRLLAETGGLGRTKLEQVQERCRLAGRPFEYAFLVDALAQERAQGITLDAARVFLRTARREYLLVDAPGHAELVRNMASGATRADAALLVVDAEEGVRENTRRHGHLLSLLGVAEVAVVVNKMDRVGYAQPAFARVVGELGAFLGGLGLSPRVFLPTSGRDGENVVSRSGPLGWFEGPTLLETLEQFPSPDAVATGPLRMPVQAVYRAGERRLVAGTVESGEVRTGEQLVFVPSGVQARVVAIEAPGGSVERAGAGQAVGLELDRAAYVERGQLAVAAGERVPAAARTFRANVVWLGERPLALDAEVTFRASTRRVRARVVEIRRAMDAASLSSAERPAALATNTVGECVLRLSEPCALEPQGAFPGAGRFVLVVEGRVQGGGVVQQVLPDAQLSPQPSPEGSVVWLTGLSGAGKSTLAVELERRLAALGKPVEWLDGDAIRHLFPSTGFSREARNEHVRRVGFCASLLEKHGVTVIVSLVSPYAESRDFVRGLCRRFVEVHVATSLEECERRDVKGLYARARRGELAHFTGIDDPYERPERPELVVDTTGLTVDSAVGHILGAMGVATHQEQAA